MPEAPEAIDVLVRTANPAFLDDALNPLGAALVEGAVRGNYKMVDDCYVVRYFGSDVGFIKFAIENKNGEFVRKLDELV